MGFELNYPMALSHLSISLIMARPIPFFGVLLRPQRYEPRHCPPQLDRDGLHQIVIAMRKNQRKVPRVRSSGVLVVIFG